MNVKRWLSFESKLDRWEESLISLSNKRKTWNLKENSGRPIQVLDEGKDEIFVWEFSHQNWLAEWRDLQR